MVYVRDTLAKGYILDMENSTKLSLYSIFHSLLMVFDIYFISAVLFRYRHCCEVNRSANIQECVITHITCIEVKYSNGYTLLKNSIVDTQ